MRKRNKKTTIVAVPELNGLTERILQQMGTEGERIRTRLLQFLQERAVIKPRENPELGTGSPAER